jgi:L,D-transpeptidase catalytic domain
VTSGGGHALDGSNTVRARGAMTIDGTRYWITTNGELIDSSRIYQISPSTFKGTTIADGAPMPAWTRKKHGVIAARTPVTIVEASADGRSVRIDDNVWMPSSNVRIAAITEPPAGTRADEKWFDVDLDTQTLVAYEGTRPVYATLVSTGKYGHFTPTLIARLASKHEATPMTSDKGDVYSVADVPWTMFYDGNYALHTSYWHDGFGGPRSHGCINLAPRDARLLFAWSSPDVPAGWSSVYGSEEQPGSLVRVRSAKLPAPKLRGYAKVMNETNVVANR